ncbi:hypothetical protein U1Q18_040513, partial [Sarracenia purpurea var. burkii]
MDPNFIPAVDVVNVLTSRSFDGDMSFRVGEKGVHPECAPKVLDKKSKPSFKQRVAILPYPKPQVSACARKMVGGLPYPCAEDKGLGTEVVCSKKGVEK